MRIKTSVAASRYFCRQCGYCCRQAVTATDNAATVAVRNMVDEEHFRIAAQGAVRLEGDVITANGSILSGQPGTIGGDSSSNEDAVSVCSCSCYPGRSSGRHRYTVRRSPSKIAHLLPLQPMGLPSAGPETLVCSELPPLHTHRASI
ncbi:Two-pore potassium channel protein sup-9 [Gryllus bimaculatus]|nr:Two-pore potassium channel protein sup-9 [Gryllus bimaculatus]